MQSKSSELENLYNENKLKNNNLSEEMKKSKEYEEIQSTKINDLDTKINKMTKNKEGYESEVDSIKKDHNQMMIKKRNLIDQLTKKIVEIKHQIQEKQSKEPEVQQFTEELEREWTKYQKLFDEYTDKSELCKKKQEEIERKEIAIKEVQKKWPADGKVKIKRGIPELNCIYEEALITNRKMANDINSLNSNIEIFKEMNSKLLQGLSLQ